MLKTRIITGAGLGVLFVLIFAFSYLPWVLPAAACALSLMSLYELNKATGFLRNRWDGCLMVFLAALLAAAPYPLLPWLAVAVFLAICAIALYLMSQVGKAAQVPGWISRIMALLIPICFHALQGIRSMEYGLYFLITAFLVGVLTDVSAYFIGSALGKHKLAPVISPHKTIEGSIGGIVVTAIGMLGISALFMPDVPIHYGRMAVYLILGSIIGELGDLAMSSIKRISGIKDYSDLLPGHGGILDRFDSILFILPFSQIFFLYFSWLSFGV